MVDFLLARRHGLPSPDQLAKLPVLEREAVVTEELGLEWGRFYVELAVLAEDKLIQEYERERNDLEDEVRNYSSPLLEEELESWMHKDGWHPEEALALTFGCKPTKSLVSWSQANKYLHRWAASVVNVHEFILSALSVKALTDPVVPQQYIAWANGKPFNLAGNLIKNAPSNHELTAKVVHVERENEILKDKIEALESRLKKSDGLEYIKLLEIFGAVCRGVYEFDRRKPRNSATKNIALAIEKYTNLIGEVTDNARDKWVRRQIQKVIDTLPEKHRIQIDSEGTSDSK